LHTSHRLCIIVMPRTVYRRALPDFTGPCPTTPTILENSTVTFGGFTIYHASVTCPLVSCPATKRATIEQRDPICSTGGTGATCECYRNPPLDKKLLEQRVLTGNVFTGTDNCTALSDQLAIDPADCAPVIQFLESMSSKPPIFIFAYPAF